ncbi:hypothetical protein D3C86_2042050 [compost metagenome]
MGVVLVDPLHADVAAQLVAAMATVTLFIFERRLARKAMAVKRPQLCLVAGHATGEHLHYFRLFAHCLQQEVAELRAFQ